MIRNKYPRYTFKILESVSINIKSVKYSWPILRKRSFFTSITIFNPLMPSIISPPGFQTMTYTRKQIVLNHKRRNCSITYILWYRQNNLFQYIIEFFRNEIFYNLRYYQ